MSFQVRFGRSMVPTTRTGHVAFQNTLLSSSASTTRLDHSQKPTRIARLSLDVAPRHAAPDGHRDLAVQVRRHLAQKHVHEVVLVQHLPLNRTVSDLAFRFRNSQLEVSFPEFLRFGHDGSVFLRATGHARVTFRALEIHTTRHYVYDALSKSTDAAEHARARVRVHRRHLIFVSFFWKTWFLRENTHTPQPINTVFFLAFALMMERCASFCDSSLFFASFFARVTPNHTHAPAWRARAKPSRAAASSSGSSRARRRCAVIFYFGKFEIESVWESGMTAHPQRLTTVRGWRLVEERKGALLTQSDHLKHSSQPRELRDLSGREFSIVSFGNAMFHCIFWAVREFSTESEISYTGLEPCLELKNRPSTTVPKNCEVKYPKTF